MKLSNVGQGEKSKQELTRSKDAPDTPICTALWQAASLAYVLVSFACALVGLCGSAPIRLTYTIHM